MLRVVQTVGAVCWASFTADFLHETFLLIFIYTADILLIFIFDTHVLLLFLYVFLKRIDLYYSVGMRVTVGVLDGYSTCNRLNRLVGQCFVFMCVSLH